MSTGADAKRRHAIRAMVIATMMLSTTMPMTGASIPENGDPELITDLSDDERRAFLDYWVEVFAAGERHLNDTPGYYPYAESLKESLARELVAELKVYNDSMAKEFNPVYAGPAMGLSSEEDPLTGFDGEPVTEEMVENIYAGFAAALMFDREAFFEEMGRLVSEMMPSNQTADNPGLGVNETMMKHAVLDSMAERPMRHWANPLAFPPPAPLHFVQTDVETRTIQPPTPVPSNLTRALPFSPFMAASEAEWQTPGFALDLPRLVHFLSGLTSSPADTLLSSLGKVAETADAVVRTVAGPLADFPEIAGPVHSLYGAVSAAESAIVPVKRTLPITELGLVALPPILQDLLNGTVDLADARSFAGTVNGVEFSGPWGIPQAIDLDADSVPDVNVEVDGELRLVSVTAGIETIPVFTFTRTSTINVPFEITVAYQPDSASKALVGHVIGLPAASDLFTSALDAPTSKGLKLAGQIVAPPGAFTFLAARILPNGDSTIVDLALEAAPVTYSFTASSNAAARDARLALDLGALSNGTVTLIANGTDAAFGVRLASDQIPVLSLVVAGSKVTLDASERSNVEIVLVDLDPADVSIVREERGIRIANLAPSTVIGLGEERLTYLASKRGADVTLMRDRGATGASAGKDNLWVSVEASGREFTIEISPGGITFGAFTLVPRVSIVVTSDALSEIDGLLEAGLFLLNDTLTAFTMQDVQRADVDTANLGEVLIETVSSGNHPFVFRLDHGDGSNETFMFSNLPTTGTIGLSPESITVGASDLVAQVVTVVNASSLVTGGNASQTLAVLQGLELGAAISMNDATLNVKTSGSIGVANVLGSNVMVDGDFLFESIPDIDHVLAEAIGTARQYSSRLEGLAGNLSGGLFGVSADLALDILFSGDLCQVFGKDDVRFEVCFSNVPDRISIQTELEFPAGMTIRYDASDVIHVFSVGLYTPDIEIVFAIHEIPKVIELVLTLTDLTLQMDSRIQAVLLTARLKDIVIAAGIEDLPNYVRFEWTDGSLSPKLNPGEYIGRAFLFLSTPQLSFLVDIVHIPILTIRWEEDAITVDMGDPAAAIGSITVQLHVDLLDVVIEAEHVPGFTIRFDEDGGVFRTATDLDRLSARLTVRDLLEAILVITDVPPVLVEWSESAQRISFVDDDPYDQIIPKVGSIKLQFTVLDLLLFAEAKGIPALDFSRDGDGFDLSAPTGVDEIVLIAAKGEGYFNPMERDTDFIGLFARPVNTTFGLSVRVTGIEGITISKDDAEKKQLVSVDFAVDKDLQVVVDVWTPDLVLLADLLITDLAAETLFDFSPDGLKLIGDHSGVQTSTAWLQARLFAGTTQAFNDLKEPFWPFETEGLGTGIMATTLIDLQNPGFATKWKIFAPLPTDLSFQKKTTDGIPSYDLGVGVELGKLDVRTLLRIDIPLVDLDNILTVITVSNLPAGLSVTQGLGDGEKAAAPSFSISGGAPIDEVFIGIRFDGRWYGNLSAPPPEDPRFPYDDLDVTVHDLGFPIWVSVRDIPTSVAFTLGKKDWSGGGDPFFAFGASASTLDISVYLDIGILWNAIVTEDLLNAVGAGDVLPGWLIKIARLRAHGHLLVEIEDIPAQGILLAKNGSTIGACVPDPIKLLSGDNIIGGDACSGLGITTASCFGADVASQAVSCVDTPSAQALIGCGALLPGSDPCTSMLPSCHVEGAANVCGAFSDRLGRFFVDFEFRLGEKKGDRGCIICTGIFNLEWFWKFNWGFGIERLSLQVKDLRHFTIKPGITSIINIDGELLFDLRAGVDVDIGAGIEINVKILGKKYRIVCLCAEIDFEFKIVAGFIVFQVLEKEWSINYWTWGWPCSWDDWCHRHEYAGVHYTIPGNWQFDLGISYPPLVDFRGLDLKSKRHGSGIQEYHVFLDPIILTCVNTTVGLTYGPRLPCFGNHIVPVPFFMVYAYIKYFSISGPDFWHKSHKH